MYSKFKRQLAAAAAAGLTAFALSGCAESNYAFPEKVRLAAHDSFAISDELIESFEAETGLELEIIRLGDTGALTNQLVLTKANPVADVFYGIDNTFGGVAQDGGIIDGELIRVDYSDVCFNYDIAWFEEAGLTPPKNWRALTDVAYKDLTVITNPELSSPGMAFLASTHGALGDAAAVAEYWSALKSNGVRVAGSWEDAYFSDFTRYGGDRPVVLSYASSPAAEILESGVSATAALLEECFRQTEHIGIIKNTPVRDNAQKLIDFLLGQEFQSAIPDLMYVYPVLASATLPEAWVQAATPALSTVGEDLDINANRQDWLEDWSLIFD